MRPRRSGSVQQGVAAMRQTLFPAGEPPLADTMPVSGERMDLRYAVGVLMDHRDLLRRLTTGDEATADGTTADDATGDGTTHT